MEPIPLRQVGYYEDEAQSQLKIAMVDALVASGGSQLDA